MDGHLTGNFLAIVLSVHIENSWFCHNTPPEVRILPNYTLLTRRFLTFSQFLKTPPPISFSLSLLPLHCYLRRKSYSLLLLFFFLLLAKSVLVGYIFPAILTINSCLYVLLLLLLLCRLYCLTLGRGLRH